MSVTTVNLRINNSRKYTEMRLTRNYFACLFYTKSTRHNHIHFKMYGWSHWHVEGTLLTCRAFLEDSFR